MRRERTLRQSLMVVSALAIALPLALFTMVSQAYVWHIVNGNLEAGARNDLRSVNLMLDMVLDKYTAVLYDFCTNDDTVQLIEQLDVQRDHLDSNSSRLRHQLIHICNRNEGIEGITLVTETGRIFFYDRRAASSVTSSWASVIEIPWVQRGPVYTGGRNPIPTEDDYGYTMQITRRIVDYQDINKHVGTVILNINQDVLWKNRDDSEDTKFFICENEKIIAAEDTSAIWKNIDAIDQEDRRVLSMVNEKTGWTIYNYYSNYYYMGVMKVQTALWAVSTAVLVIIVAGVIWYVTRPILENINDLVDAMNQVEEGSFTVRVKMRERIPKELVRVIDGFNAMVQRTGELIVQVKKLAEARKNAELSAMEAQIDPHFLYNTLDTINWKAIEHEEYEISQMVGALADILRYSIRNPGDTVSINQEIYWLGQYVMLQKEKLEAPLQVVVDVPEELQEYRIHKLLLQPFLENAIKHGLYQKKGECCLKIRMRLADDQIHIMVEDNGKGIDKAMLELLNEKTSSMGEHVGVANVRKRLELYYGDDADIYFESKKGCYTIVHLFVKAIGGEEVVE